MPLCITPCHVLYLMVVCTDPPLVVKAPHQTSVHISLIPERPITFHTPTSISNILAVSLHHIQEHHIMPVLWLIAFFYDKRRARREAERMEAAKAAKARRQALESAVAIQASPPTARMNDSQIDTPNQAPVSPGGKGVKRMSGCGGYDRLEEH